MLKVIKWVIIAIIIAGAIANFVVFVNTSDSCRLLLGLFNFLVGMSLATSNDTPFDL